MRFKENVELAKREINDDIARGVQPRNVSTFEDLHDHADANTYGGVCDGFSETFSTSLEWHEAVSDIQNELDKWLRAGRPA